MIFAALCMVAASCAQLESQHSPAAGETVKIRFCAEFPGAAPDTRVALGETGALSWKGGETATLIFGKDANNSDNPVIASVEPGVFEGEITIPNGFELSDLCGIVVPSENGANFRLNGSKRRIRMIGYTEQTQQKDGELNPMYAPFFVPVTSEELVKNDDGTYCLPSVKLLSAHDLIRFNVFGKHADSKADERVLSVNVTASGKLCCSFEYGVDGSGLGTNGASYGTVTLAEPALLPEAKADGVKLFLGVSLGGDRTVTEVVVKTDKAEYTKIVKQSLLQKRDFTALRVYNANLDLSTFSRKDTEREDYYKRKVLSIAKRALLPSIQVTYTHGDDMISFVVVNEDYYAKEDIKQENAQLTTRSVYQACSMSKVPMAYMAMKMVEEGKLDLMKPVYQYYGVYSDDDEITDEQEDADNAMLALFADEESKVKAKKITTKMLLLHTTGLDNATYSGITSGSEGIWKVEPDYTTYKYSGPAVHILDLLLGKILGDLHGEDYNDLAKYSMHYIFNKIGIVDANYFWKDEYSTLAAVGHYSNGTWGTGSKWTEANAAYTLRTSTEEYTKFLKWINKGADFTGGVESENYKAMFAQYGVDQDSETAWQGLIWRIENHADLGLVYHHRGNNTNFNGWMCTIPEQDKTLMYMTNGQASYNYYQAVAELFLGAKLAALDGHGSALPAEESDSVGNAGKYDVELE